MGEEECREDSEEKRKYKVTVEDSLDDVKFGLTASEIVRPFVPLFGEALTVVKEILKAYDDAQYNRRCCKTLINRVQAAEAAVKILKRSKEENEENFRRKEYYDSFQRFLSVLRRTKTFVQDVTHLSGYRKFVSSASIKEKFANLVSDFDYCVSDLQLAMIIANEDQRKKDLQILEEDLSEMAKFLDGINGGVTTMVNIGKKNSISINILLETIETLKEKIDNLSIGGQPKGHQKNNINFKLAEIDPNDLEDIPEFQKSHDKVIKKRYRKFMEDVCCKPVKMDEVEKQKNEVQLAILEKIPHSSYIIKFWGKSYCPDLGTVLVYEWASHGTLKSLYEEYELEWYDKLRIAVNICRGIVFLHGCEIFHHDIRCANILITDKMDPKITNFHLSRIKDEASVKIPNIGTVINWMAPEKMRSYDNSKHFSPYTVQCEIFSFGMLLWELAFQRIPYKGMEVQDIQKHVKGEGREKMNFGLAPTPLQEKFCAVIKKAWQQEPSDRPDIKYMFNELHRIFNENFSQTKSPSLRPRSSNVEVTAPEPPESPHFLFEQLISVEQGIRAHKKKEHEKAWKSDEGIAEAQLRYAFGLKDTMGEQLDHNIFTKYLMLAAAGGNVSAQFNLGSIYIYGKYGFEKNQQKGEEYLRLAAIKGSEQACKLLEELKVVIIRS
ncbi:12379_t:CDS:2 [Acaulospora morrowiae]|uniref:12379_t:CDS:1 n=1 Tax=Acaulospora morrowiae TaxID=94023 RepID=A0A9N8ZAY6_9GLOM|nr:12379_t:CDS:2 [Acaulospora morrowiae]